MCRDPRGQRAGRIPAALTGDRPARIERRGLLDGDDGIGPGRDGCTGRDADGRAAPDLGVRRLACRDLADHLERGGRVL